MQQRGYTVIFDPEAKNGRIEQDLFTCYHCQLVVQFSPGVLPEDAGGLCKVCNKLICQKCYSEARCDPFERKLERIEARQRAQQSYGV